MTKLYDFKDQVTLDVKDYISKHKEINPIDDFESAYYQVSHEFDATDAYSSEMVDDTIYEILNQMVNEMDGEEDERV